MSLRAGASPFNAYVGDRDLFVAPFLEAQDRPTPVDYPLDATDDPLQSIRKEAAKSRFVWPDARARDSRDYCGRRRGDPSCWPWRAGLRMPSCAYGVSEAPKWSSQILHHLLRSSEPICRGCLTAKSGPL